MLILFSASVNWSWTTPIFSKPKSFIQEVTSVEFCFSCYYRNAAALHALFPFSWLVFSQCLWEVSGSQLSQMWEETLWNFTDSPHLTLTFVITITYIRPLLYFLKDLCITSPIKASKNPPLFDVAEPKSILFTEGQRQQCYCVIAFGLPTTTGYKPV